MLTSNALGRPGEKLINRWPRYWFRGDVNGKIVPPPTQAFDVKVYANWQPILSRSVGENLDAKDALDALEWGILLVVGGVGVRNRCLANNLKLQLTPKPWRTGKQAVILGKPRPEIPVEGAFSLLV